MNDKVTEERNEIFDSAIREQLAGYEPVVPHALWNRISSQLDGDNDVAIAAIEGITVPQTREINRQGKWRMAIAAAFHRYQP